MHLSKPRCPDCDILAAGTLETIPGAALLSWADEEAQDGGGHADYTGETKVFWDGQTTNTGRNGGFLLYCHQCGGEWESDIMDSEEYEEFQRSECARSN